MLSFVTKPLLRVFSSVCADFGVIAVAASVSAWQRPLTLTAEFIAGTIFWLLAFKAEQVLESLNAP